MAPKKGNRERAAKAYKAMKPFGISTETIKPALKRLLDAYDNNWTYIEDDNYRVLIETIFEPQDTKIMNSTTVKQDFKLRDEPDEEEEAELPKKKIQTCFSSPSGSCSHYVSEMQQTVETQSVTMVDILEDHEKGKKLMPQFEIPLSVIHPEASPSCDDDSWSKSLVEGKELLALEYKSLDENENEAPPFLSEIEIASSCDGEVKMVLCICKPPEGFSAPSFDAVLKQVEERYSERFKGLGADFSLSKVLKDVCESLKEEGGNMNMNMNM